MCLLYNLPGKIVFTAPSRPLVMQQIEACHNIVGIPQVDKIYAWKVHYIYVAWNYLVSLVCREESSQTDCRNGQLIWQVKWAQWSDLVFGRLKEFSLSLLKCLKRTFNLVTVLSLFFTLCTLYLCSLCWRAWDVLELVITTSIFFYKLFQIFAYPARLKKWIDQDCLSLLFLPELLFSFPCLWFWAHYYC